ncbi:hypothetical protein BRD56_02925 [Thermoplasmatales archaeon SW_10_69_26]|nr:MAG: hypothetical protein BRD56_02925 [Thermoplasmatales archaeon SW_10_69_26]
MVDLALVTAALAAGAATFFSPCSVALIPAYAGFFLGLDEDRPRPTREAARRGLGFGLAAAAGILTLFAAGGLGLYALRSLLDVATPQLGEAISLLGLLASVTVFALGTAYLLDRGPRATSPVRAPRKRSLPAMAAFGVVFALGSVGCSLPVLFGVLVQGLAQGALGTLVTVLAYGLGLAALMAVVGLLLSLAHDETRRRIEAIRPYARPASGLVLVAAGIYMFVYYVTTGPIG